MLLTDKIKIKVNSGFHIKHFKDNGYNNIKFGDEIEIDISLLPKGSHETITAKCDYCGDIKELFYKEYNYSIRSNNKFCCSKCIPLKNEETCRKKYGKKSFTETDEFKEKSEKTCLKKYKVDRYCKTKKCVKKSKETSLKRYGETHYSKTDEYKTRCKEVFLKNYGVENVMQNPKSVEKLQNTLLERTGYKHALQNPKSIDKSRKTSIKRYGVDSYAKTNKFRNKMKRNSLNRTTEEKNEILEKSKSTCLKKYGVEYSSQNVNIHEKQQISAFKLKKYKNLFYRGTYELNFLETFYDKILIEKPKSIIYDFDNKNRRYHPDFYIKQFNLIVEVKSSYTYNYDIEKNEAKKKASLESGYNFIFIIDKDYKEFINKISLN